MNFFHHNLIPRGSIRKIALGTAIVGSALFGIKEANATPVTWSSISDIVPQTVGESINYNSSSSSSLPNKLTAICYVIEGGIWHAIGGFDLQNGVVTNGYYNKDWNVSGNGYGLNTGDTANTGTNPGNSYSIGYKVFYDYNGNNILGTHVGEDIYDGSEQVDPSKYQITGFSPYGSQNPGVFTFTTTILAPSTSALAALNMASLGGGTNQVTFSVAVSNAVTFSVTYKNSLTNATWESLGTYSKTGAVTVVTDTNNVPQRFYRVVTP